MTRNARRVLIVGATGRLGVAIAEALARRGDKLVLTARDPNKLEGMRARALATLAEQRGGAVDEADAVTVCADLTRPDAVDDIVAGTRAKVGAIDDVILACGPFPRTPFDELTRADLERTFGVHAVAPLLLVHAFKDDLARSQGAVVGLGDAGTTRPYTNHVAYLTAKGALRSGLLALSAELAPDVRVNMVELGIVADPEADDDPLRHHRLATRSSLGRFGTPEEVVHVVLSLLDAQWATGEVWGVGR